MNHEKPICIEDSCTIRNIKARNGWRSMHEKDMQEKDEKSDLGKPIYSE